MYVQIKPRPRKILRQIYNAVYEREGCQISYNKLAREARTTESDARYGVQELMELGYVERITVKAFNAPRYAYIIIKEFEDVPSNTGSV